MISFDFMVIFGGSVLSAIVLWMMLDGNIAGRSDRSGEKSQRHGGE